MPLKEITPLHLRCGFGQCIGIYKIIKKSLWNFFHKEEYMIIGKTVKMKKRNRTEWVDLPNKDFSSIFEEYEMIRIPIEYIDNIGGPLSRLARRLGL